MKQVLIISRHSNERRQIASAFAEAGIFSRSVSSDFDALAAIEERCPAIIVWSRPAGEIPPDVFLALLDAGGFQGKLITCCDLADLDDVPCDRLLLRPIEIEALIRAVQELNCLIELSAGRDASHGRVQRRMEDSA